MARSVKIEQEVKVDNLENVTKTLDAFQAKIDELEKQVVDLQERLAKPVKKESATINKLEGFNGDVDASPREDSRMRLTESDKVVSAINAAKILPPNLIVDGRHSAENIGAICGFVVDEELLDKVYETVSHDWKD